MAYDENTAIVSRYLEWVNERRGQGKQNRSIEWMDARIEQLTGELASSEMSWTVRLRRTQRLHDLIDQRDDAADDPTEAFVKVCTAYSIRYGITDAAWRELGVPAKVLRAADDYASNGKGH